MDGDGETKHLQHLLRVETIEGVILYINSVILEAPPVDKIKFCLGTIHAFKEVSSMERLGLANSVLQMRAGEHGLPQPGDGVESKILRSHTLQPGAQNRRHRVQLNQRGRRGRGLRLRAPYLGATQTECEVLNPDGGVSDEGVPETGSLDVELGHVLPALPGPTPAEEQDDSTARRKGEPSKLAAVETAERPGAYIATVQRKREGDAQKVRAAAQF